MSCEHEASFYDMNYSSDIGNGITSFYECPKCGTKMQLDVPYKNGKRQPKNGTDGKE
jgi:hypothetical protein